MNQTIINNILTNKWFKGRVVKNRGRGRKLGFPTLNLQLAQLPGLKKGVYSCQTKINNQIYQGLLHFGPRLTFQEKKPSLEIYLLNFNQELKQKTLIRFRLLKFLRKTKRFNNKEDLRKQIIKDIKALYPNIKPQYNKG